MNLNDHILRRFPVEPPFPSEPLAEGLLAKLLSEKSNRLAHSLGAGRLARELASTLNDSMLETACLFHDIGYSPLLKVTGYHPLDGAIFLAHHGVDERIVAAVLCHSGAAFKAAEKPEIGPFYAELALDSHERLADLVTFCDLRTSWSGSMVTLSERVSDAVERHGPSSAVTRHMPSLLPEYRLARDRVLKMIADSAPNPLPWLFIDVDSTLVLPGGEVSSRNRDSLAAYTAAGGHISLATGRHPHAILELARSMGLPGPHLAGNGAIVIEDGMYHLIDGISGHVRELDEYLRGERVPFSLYTPSGVFVTSQEVDDSHLGLLRAIDEPTPDMANAPDWENAFKILMFIPKESTELEASLRQKATEVGVSCVRTAHDFLELISITSGKASAMTKILRDREWPLLHTTAIGDSENDLCLLRQAGYAVVVGNASQHMKRIADEVIPPCTDDGVAAYISSFVKRL